MLAEDEARDLLLVLHELGQFGGHPPEDQLVVLCGLGEEARAVLELQHHEHRRLLLQHMEERDHHFHGLKVEDLVHINLGPRLSEQLLHLRQMPDHLRGHDLLESLGVVGRQGVVQMTEDRDRGAQQLRGRARALVGPGAHDTEDGHHLELCRAVRHDVLRELLLAQAGDAFDHDDAAFGEGAARWSTHPRGGRRDGLLVLVQ
mmetsp:Transcript_44432/g.117455  ORF Transcript_44432/g.117455 Transcript_44432/m.117455 type:complete len:203 (+) Transcript_44432:852-1460(+)